MKTLVSTFATTLSTLVVLSALPVAQAAPPVVKPSVVKPRPISLNPCPKGWVLKGTVQTTGKGKDFARTFTCAPVKPPVKCLSTEEFYWNGCTAGCTAKASIPK